MQTGASFETRCAAPQDEGWRFQTVSHQSGVIFVGSKRFFISPSQQSM